METQPTPKPESQVGLTALLGAQVIDWKDINRCVDDIRTANATLNARTVLGKRMVDAAGRQYSRHVRLRAVAMLHAGAYNGMF